MDVALGKAYPDTIITNGVLVDVATRRLIKGINISISGGRIASISKERQRAGPDTDSRRAGLFMARRRPTIE
jgi:adenine deaminase